MPATAQQRNVEAQESHIGRNVAVGTNSHRTAAPSYGFGLCALLFAVSTAATCNSAELRSIHNHGGSFGSSGSSSGSTSASSSGAPTFPSDRYLPDYMEDMFYDAFCYHDYFTDRADCPANLEELHRASKRLFGNGRKSSRFIKKRDDDEEDEASSDEQHVTEDILSSVNDDELSTQQNLHDMTDELLSSSAAEIHSVHSLASSSEPNLPSSVLLRSAAVSPVLRAATTSPSDDDEVMSATVLVPQWMANMQRVADATRDLLRRALPSTGSAEEDLCFAEMFMRALVCVPYSSAMSSAAEEELLRHASSSNPRALSATLHAAVAARRRMASGDAQSHVLPSIVDKPTAATAQPAPATKLTTASSELSDDVEAPQGGNDDAVVHRLFLGQLRKEATPEFVVFILQHIIGIDVEKDIVKVEMHTSSATAHNNSRQRNAGATTIPSVASTGRAKGCAWVDVRGTAARNQILAFHKRLYLGDATMLESHHQVRDDDVVSAAHAQEEYVVVVDEDHKDWLAGMASMWTDHADRNREFLSRGPIVVEIPKQSSPAAGPSAKQRGASSVANAAAGSISALQSGRSCADDATGGADPHARQALHLRYQQMSTCTPQAAATPSAAGAPAYFSKVSSLSSGVHRGGASRHAVAAAAASETVFAPFSQLTNDARDDDVVVWRHHPYDWGYSRLQIL